MTGALTCAAARSVLIGPLETSGAPPPAMAAGRRIALAVSFSVRCTTNCGYSPSAITIATRGTIAARFTRSISRDSTAAPTRPCIVPW